MEKIMIFIKRELERIEGALREPQSADRYCQLYAAQQALAWVSDPVMFSAPFDTVDQGRVTPIDTAAG